MKDVQKVEIGHEPIYDVSVLSLPKQWLLSIQHVFSMSGSTVLVPILIASYFVAAGLDAPTKGLTVSTTLLGAGIGTLILHVITWLAGHEVPVFLGSSFAFLGGFATVASLDTGIYAAMDANTKAAYACGGIVAAGLLYVVVAVIIKLVGTERVMRVFPPVVTGPVIACIGLTLAPSAISNAKQNWILALVAIFVMVVFQQWGKGMLKIVPILMGFVISYIVALVMHWCGFTNADGSAILNFATVSEAKVFGIPPMQLPKFDPNIVLIMASPAIAAMMEHVGDVSAVSSTTRKNYLKHPGLWLTLLCDGLATAVAALFGSPANTTYGENTGTLTLTRVYDPKVIRRAAYITVFISFFPWLSAAIATMPSAIVGGISFMLYGMISVVGFRNIKENNVNLDNPRNVIIIAVEMVCGLGLTDGLPLSIFGTTVTLTGLAIAPIAGIALNLLLPKKEDEYGAEDHSSNSGVNFDISPKGGKIKADR